MKITEIRQWHVRRIQPDSYGAGPKFSPQEWMAEKTALLEDGDDPKDCSTALFRECEEATLKAALRCVETEDLSLDFAAEKRRTAIKVRMAAKETAKAVSKPKQDNI